MFQYINSYILYLLVAFVNEVNAVTGSNVDKEGDNDKEFEKTGLVGDIDIDPDEVIHRFKHMGKFRNRFNDFYCKYYCWPGGIVPYYFDPNFASLDESYGDGCKTTPKQQVLKAMAHISEHTCIKFKKRSNADKRFIIFRYGNGCSSKPGRNYDARPQDISLGVNCTLTVGTPIHEIMHALGFYHEHMRSDRDKYISVQENNILPGLLGAFGKISSAVIEMGTPYDYSSVMHYSNYAFTANGKPTLVSLDTSKKIGQRDFLSHIDILEINKMYGCSNYL